LSPRKFRAAPEWQHYTGTVAGIIVCSDDFSSITTLNGLLTGYDSNGNFGAGFSDAITAVSPSQL